MMPFGNVGGGLCVCGICHFQFLCCTVVHGSQVYTNLFLYCVNVLRLPCGMTDYDISGAPSCGVHKLR